MNIAEVSEARLQAFGQICRLVIDNSDGQASDLHAICSEELQRLEKKFSSFQPESLISRINDCAGTGAFVPLDPEASSLFDFVSALWAKSNHLFDPTTRVLQNCYANDGRLRASVDQLQRMVKLVGMDNVEHTEKGVHLARKGMQIDLDSCIRPYAVDSLRKILLREGVSHALIEMRQDFATIGKRPGGDNWLVGVRLPRQSSVTISRLKLNNMSFSIRGDFEQAILIEGERYGRALSPVDGQPIPGLLSIGATADSCLTACSAASIARLKTEASAIKWLDSLGLSWIAVDRTLQCHGALAPG